MWNFQGSVFLALEFAIGLTQLGVSRAPVPATKKIDNGYQ